MKIFTIVSLCAFIIATNSYGSDQTVRSFFEAAKKGDYRTMLQIVQTAQFTPSEINNARDEQGNTFLNAALLGYGPALRQLGSKAEQTLFDTFTLLFLRLSKHDALTLVSKDNNAKETPLFIAAELGLYKVTWLLHDKGALSAIGSKKASTLTKNTQLRNILLNWENLEGDWVDLGTAQK